MISGANEEQLELANDRADILLLQKENQELKKQLEEKTKIGISDHKYASKCEDKVIIMENQQKEFIDWLSNTIKEMENTPADDIHQQVEKDSCLAVADTISSKYKEIIGGKDD